MKFCIKLLTILLFFSCVKKVSVTGHVYNPVTNEGISGISVKLRKKKADVPGSQDGTGYKTLEETTTDENGYYSITDRASKIRQNKVVFTFDDDLYHMIEANEYVISTDQKNWEVDFRLIPTSHIKHKIDNESCFDENDLLSITRYYSYKDIYGTGVSNYSGCFHYEFTGSVDGSPEGYTFTPMGWHFYQGTVTKNGITTAIKDSIFLTKGGFHTWHIQY